MKSKTKNETCVLLFFPKKKKLNSNPRHILATLGEILKDLNLIFQRNLVIRIYEKKYHIATQCPIMTSGQMIPSRQ